MIKFSGGNGGSIEDAVIIMGAKYTLEGIQAEKRYISKALLRIQNVEWELLGQQLIKKDGCYFDRLTIVVDNLQETQFYFDISDFLANIKMGVIPDVLDLIPKANC